MNFFISYYYKKRFSSGIDSILFTVGRSDNFFRTLAELEERLKDIVKARKVKIIVFERLDCLEEDLKGGVE